ncbi:MAG: hypothetical protein U0930_00275 [Pirellulales bacterium]
MSRRRIVVGIGLLASSFAGPAFAQQPSGNNGYGQAQLQGQPNYSQTVYAQQPVAATGAYPKDAASAPNAQQGYAQPPNGAQPVYNQVSFGRHQAQAAYAQPMQSSGCGDPNCTSCGAVQYGNQQYGYYAEQPSSFWTNYYRNVRWPTPFRAQDVMSVTNYFDIQRENGWRLHNTVGNAMFDPQTNCLTQAGKNHIQSILRDNPSNRKVVFVLQAQNQQQTAARVQSTELAISEFLPVGELPPVYVTDRDAPGSSGAYQAAMSRAMMTSVPVPRLSAQGGGSGGSSSSPAGGAGAGSGSGSGSGSSSGR